MTRKDYVAIAEALSKTRPNQDNDTRQWDVDRMAIADVLADDNPRFDRERFYRACEGEK